MSENRLDLSPESCYFHTFARLPNGNNKPNSIRLECGKKQQLRASVKAWIQRTDAIKANLDPCEEAHEQAAMKYADEADVLNIAMLGMTAKQWREQNPDKKGNIRDYVPTKII